MEKETKTKITFTYLDGKKESVTTSRAVANRILDEVYDGAYSNVKTNLLEDR